MQSIKETLKQIPIIGNFQPVNIIFSDAITFEDKTSEFVEKQFELQIERTIKKLHKEVDVKKQVRKIRIIEEEEGEEGKEPKEPRPREPREPKPRGPREKKPTGAKISEEEKEDIFEEEEETPVELTEQENFEFNQVSQIVNFIRREQNDRTLNIETSYYLNNRKRFTNFIERVFNKYKVELEKHSKPASCDTISSNNKLSLLVHQKLITDYLNLYTPYRGLLLFHGLGSGKTCSSIAIAENFKNANKKIIVLTPASLKPNFIKEIKKCGNFIYRLNNQWVWKNADQLIGKHSTLERELNLPLGYIRKNEGVWVMEPGKHSGSRKKNYNAINRTAKHTLDEQITQMIQFKYKHLSYNGLRKSHIKEMSENYTINPFDNTVIIIDEVHKFISPIVNKLKASPKKKDELGVALSLYNFILSAKNARVILLTGTPVMNYPNEIAVLFNMIRGFIHTFELTLNISTQERITNETLYSKLSQTAIGRQIDYFHYSPSNKLLTITRNPPHFLNKISERTSAYSGVKLEETKSEELAKGDISNEDFISGLYSALQDIGVEITSIEEYDYKNIPDNFDSFMTRFYSGTELINKEQLSNRLIGLTSYFSGTPELLPRYKKEENYHLVTVPMSEYQFDQYRRERSIERDSEKKSRKRKNMQKDIFDEQPSTYRIFSRLYCNFAMPETIKRPKPGMFEEIKDAEENKTEEEEGSTEKKKRVEKNDFEEVEEKDADESLDKDKKYIQEIQRTLSILDQHSDEYLSPAGLSIYSPKYLAIIQNIQNPDHIGCHLVYSQFRSMEGIGIFCLALEENGFAEFKIDKNSSGKWTIVMKEEDVGKPTYALYTGKETKEVKEIIMNIYNGFFDLVPSELVTQLQGISPNNNFGEIIKIFMITASGAEGLDLKNTRYVHIMEPFWNFVRIEQVIGRAVRICSHKNLPEELRNVEAFVYLSVFSEQQIEKNKKTDLMIGDMGKVIHKPLTTDEYLYEMSMKKEQAISQLIQTVKETAIDCSVYPNNRAEGIVCHDSTNTSLEYSYHPNLETDLNTNVKKNVS